MSGSREDLAAGRDTVARRAMQPAPQTRLFVILARAAPVAAVLRRGPTRHEWLKGRVYEPRGDLAPDGRRRHVGPRRAVRDAVGGQLRSAPIVAGDTVVVGSALGNLYAVSRATGAVTWSTNVGAGIAAPDEQNVSQPLTGLATSGGLPAYR